MGENVTVSIGIMTILMQNILRNIISIIIKNSKNTSLLKMNTCMRTDTHTNDMGNRRIFHQMHWIFVMANNGRARAHLHWACCFAFVASLFSSTFQSDIKFILVIYLFQRFSSFIFFFILHLYSFGLVSHI